MEKIRVWFRDYKTPDGKPQNKFGYNDQVSTANWCSSAFAVSPTAFRVYMCCTQDVRMAAGC